MSTRTSTRVRDAFDAAIELPQEQRRAFVERACAADAALRDEVLSLLASLEQCGDALDSNAASAGWADDELDNDSDADARIVGLSIGGFKLVRRIGVGGMGTVYEAVQENPSRTVALKVLRAWSGSPSARRRFVEEAQILARLRHPGIAQIFAAGTHAPPGTDPSDPLAGAWGGAQAVPWIAMEFVEGATPITGFVAAGSLDPRQALLLMAQVCDAVHHGHMRGIIHRDLKPANILVDSNGNVKVIDFGVARAVLSPEDGTRASAATVTSPGTLVGTLRYMSPEQCDGDPHALDTRSDVYSLGVVLYEVLTGTLPYQLGNGSFTAAARAIRETDPAPPASIRRGLRGDVEVIVLKSLEKERDRRYQSAADLASDIRRFLADLPIQARPASAVYRAAKFARRNKAAVALAALVLVSVAAGVAGVGISLTRALRAEHNSRIRTIEAERQSYVANIFAADSAITFKDGGTALTRLEAAPASRRGWEWGHLHALADQSAARMIAPVPGAYTVSPDGRSILCRSDAGVVTLFDSSFQHERWSVSLTPILGALCFDRDGSLALIPGEETALVVRCSDGAILATLALGKGVLGLGGTFAPGGDLVAVGCSQINNLQVFNLRSGERVFSGSSGPWVYNADFSPDGTMLADSEFPDVVVREVGSWRELARIASGRPSPIEPSFVRFSPDGRTLAVSIGLDIQLLDVGAPKPTRTLHGHTQRIQSLNFDARGARLVTGSVDKTVRVWDVAGSVEPLVLLGHGAAVTSVAFVPGDTPGGERCWSSAAEPVVRLWDPRPSRVVSSFTFVGATTQVHRLSFSHDSHRLLGLCASQLVELAIPRSVPLETTITAPVYGYPVADLLSRTICGVENDSRIVLRDLDGLAVRWSINDPDASRVSALSPDGRLVATSMAVSGVRLLRQSDGSRVAELSGTGLKTRTVAFSPDSSFLATAGEDSGPARIWDLSSFRLVAEFPSAGHIIESLAFSPDGARIASGGADHRVHIWNSRTGVEIRTLSGFNSTVWCAAFSPDGKRLAVGSQDRIARVFDADTGDELLQLRRHTGTVMSLAWSPDGRFLATGGYDQQIIVWDSAGVAGEGLGTNGR